MLLESLVACAGVTFNVVATAMAIPFRSLRYRAGPNQVWGVQLRRAVRRNDFGLNHGSPAIAMRIERALDINGNIHDIDSGGRPGSRKHIDREAGIEPQ